VKDDARNQDETGAAGTTGRKAASGADLRSLRRAEKQAEKAAKAQRRADEARERALAAARAGGLLDEHPGTATAAGSEKDRATATEPDTATDTTVDTDPSPDTESAADSAPGRRPGAVSASAGSAAAGSSGRRASGPVDRRVPAALAAATVLLLLLTGLATWGYLAERENTRTEQTISAAPHEATDSAREIVTQMFTYDHRTVDADLGKVRDRLTGPALKEFVDKSMPTVASSAKQQQASVMSTVAAAAPQEVADAEHVTVLVMLNRMVSTKDNPKATASASRLTVSMVREDGAWKLSQLKTL